MSPDPKDGANSKLQHLEAIIECGLPHYGEMAVALLEIKEGKLYRGSYKSFSDYVAKRWRFSRARAYQMLHFARLKRMSTTVDTADPVNERQARTLDAQGNRRHHQKDDPELRLLKHIHKVFEGLRPAERRGMIDCIRKFLAELEEEIEEEGGD